MGLHDSRVAVGGSGDGRRRAGQVAGQVGEEVWEPSTQVTGHATSPTGSRVSSPRKCGFITLDQLGMLLSGVKYSRCLGEVLLTCIVWLTEG